MTLIVAGHTEAQRRVPLPSVNHLSSGFSKGRSSKSVLLERVRLIISEQEWVKSGDDSVGIKEAGFKVLQVFRVTSRLSRRRA